MRTTTGKAPRRLAAYWTAQSEECILKTFAVKPYTMSCAPSSAMTIPRGAFILQRMAKAASDYALPGNIDPRVFEETLLNEGLAIVRSLRWALVRDEKENPSPNFWDNNAKPLEKIKAKQVPYIDHSGLEAVVGEYLALPYRCQALDRFLVRVLIAMELYAYGDEMLNEETFGLFPARSPLRQRHALLGYGDNWLMVSSLAEWLRLQCGVVRADGSDWAPRNGFRGYVGSCSWRWRQ
jgi:hypothetical protein